MARLLHLFPITTMTFNDLPAASALTTLALTDIVGVYDASAHPNGERKMTVGNFMSQALPLALAALPTSDPSSAGALYLNNGVLTVSSGA